MKNNTFNIKVNRYILNKEEKIRIFEKSSYDIEGYGELLFLVVSGSTLYGTRDEGSDIDIKGVYIPHLKNVLNKNTPSVIELNNNNENYYLIDTFIEHINNSNPNSIEMLFTPDEYVIYKSTLLDEIFENKTNYISKRCIKSFTSYANKQIRKANGEQKYMNWSEDRKKRKTILDFIYVYNNGLSININEFIKSNNLDINKMGLSKLNHMRDNYNLYYDYEGDFNFNGLVTKNIDKESNDVKLSNIPKGVEPLALIHFNKDAYSIHCKEYKGYIEYLNNVNENRKTITKNNQIIDGKNMLHNMRLALTSIDIGMGKTDFVVRDDEECKYLLEIKNGYYDTDSLIEKASSIYDNLEDLYKKNGIKDDVIPTRENFLFELKTKYYVV